MKFATLALLAGVTSATITIDDGALAGAAEKFARGAHRLERKLERLEHQAE